MIGLTASSALGASQQVVVNSADWQDIYTGMHYADFNGLSSKFIISSEHAPTLLTILDQSRKNVFLIESDKTPFAFGYKSSLEAANFNVEEIRASGTALNIELAKRASTKKFIVVDDSYGYNAISVAPYAAKNKYFVLLANKQNIDEFYSFLKNNGVDSLIIYGYTDIEVRTKLTEFNPETINRGDRFENNLEMVKRYGSSQQIILTNGEFIEEEIMSGREPVLFLGRESVPDQVIEYVRDSDIKTGVVIGNELADAAHQLKEETNISIFLKFGQGFGSGGFAEVKALDMFPVPKYELNIDIGSIKYNSATKSLEVTYENKGKIGSYLRSSIEVFSSGSRIATLGDREPVFVNRENTLTVAYASELNGENLTAKVTTLFGEVPRSLERVLRKDMNIELMRAPDNSAFNISGVSYDKDAHKLRIAVKNTGGVAAYANAQVTLLIYGEENILTQNKPMLIEPGVSMDAVFITTLSDTNIEENPLVKVRLNYGERESALVKVLEGNYPLEIRSNMLIPVIAAALVAAAIIGIIVLRRKRKRSA
ncbi:MAG: cell wall-binding repeat-containing protein [Candidatus Methanoperedens sp.]|nr:cell wall-binding repeat-containing protein [Candidatus Methanoperedens sp.]